MTSTTPDPRTGPAPRPSTPSKILILDSLRGLVAFAVSRFHFNPSRRNERHLGLAQEFGAPRVAGGGGLLFTDTQEGLFVTRPELGLFASGFESGDTSEWSVTVP